MLKKIQKQKARQALTVLIPLVQWGWPTTWRCICCLHVSMVFFLIVFGLQLHPHIGHNSQNVSYPRPVTESLIFLYYSSNKRFILIVNYKYHFRMGPVPYPRSIAESRKNDENFRGLPHPVNYQIRYVGNLIYRQLIKKAQVKRPGTYNWCLKFGILS